MGSSIYCCPDKEFITSTEEEFGTFRTKVEYKKGSTLKLFCDYGNLNVLKKFKELSPAIANDKYLFYKEEMTRMISYLSGREDVKLEKLIVYKICFYGTVGYDAHSITQEKILIEFTLTALCKRNEEMEELHYTYHWKRDGMHGLNHPRQKVEFFKPKETITISIGGEIKI